MVKYEVAMPTTTNPAAKPDLESPPKSSALRLYDPETQGNSFSLDGFPALKEGKDWLTRLIEIVENWGALNMTTNQTLFRQLTEAGVLDERLRVLKGEGRSASETYWTLYNEAAMQAARAFEAIHARWPWEGRVSQEASALLTEVDLLVKDVQRIARLMQGVGAFTKIPNLPVGPQAIRKAVSGDSPRGDTLPGRVSPSGSVPVVHPNITLVFSDRHYLQTVEGYLLGLNARVNRQDLERITSVNSLFVSRLDRVVDPMIDERFRILKGKTAIAQAKKIAQMFGAIFLEDPFEDPEGIYQDEEGKALLGMIGRLRDLYASLKKWGARPQRLLIASSGVKAGQPYSSLLYVLPFLGPWSANTMPEGTFEALSKWISGLSDEQAVSLRTRNVMSEPLPAISTDAKEWDQALLMMPEERRQAGIGDLTPDRILRDVQALVLGPKNASLRALCDTLRDQGAASFTADEQATLRALQTKLQAL